jgi:hypothetical protein
MISLLERDELDRVMKVLDDAGVVDRDGESKLSALERVRRVLSELKRSRETSSKQRIHSCNLPGCISCGNPELVQETTDCHACGAVVVIVDPNPEDPAFCSHCAHHI